MICIFDRWTGVDERDSSNSRAISDTIAMVLQDDGFLPDYVISPWRSYTQGGSVDSHPGTPLFADLLPVPELWEIVMYYDRAEIWDEGTKKAEIEYAQPTELHNVKSVRWMLPDGAVYRADHYDKYGNLYYDELLAVDGSVNVRTYYADGKPVIMCQPKRTLYTLMEHGKIVHMFDSQYSFLAYFICNVFPDEMLIVSDDKWISQELCSKGIPCRLTERFEAVFPENLCGQDAYILTHTDQVEQLEYLVTRLPDIHFHVAAITAMSDKLLNLDRYPNISLYQGISEQKREELLQKCTLYLDINHYQEICDVVYGAYRHNLLIVGFDETLHNPAYVLPQCIFPAAEVDKMAGFLKDLFEDEEKIKKLAAEQGKMPLKEILREDMI